MARRASAQARTRRVTGNPEAGAETQERRMDEWAEGRTDAAPREAAARKWDETDYSLAWMTTLPRPQPRGSRTHRGMWSLTLCSNLAVKLALSVAGNS